MSRHALLIGTATYPSDHSLASLPAVHHDLTQLTEVLNTRGGFDTVDTHTDLPHQRIERLLEEFFSNRRTGDTLLLYFSGHGITDEDRTTLFLAGTDTEEKHLRSTAVNAHSTLRPLLDTTRASQKMVFLDCCFSGAFGKQYQARGGTRANVDRALQHRGTFVFTASDRLQVAREHLGASGRPSVFTGVLLDALRGRARPSLADGWLTAQDVADYVQDEMSIKASGQNPCLFNEGVTGPIPLVQTDDAPDVTATAQQRGPVTGRSETGGADAPFDASQWRRLLTYYRRCMQREAVLGEFVEVRKRDQYVLAPEGPELVFSTAHETLPTGGALGDFARRVSGPDVDLFYGYPLVITRQRKGNVSVPVFAPLLISEVSPDATGRLCVTIPATVNQSLLRHLGLSEAEIEERAGFVESQLRPGDMKSLTTVVRSILNTLDIDPGQVDPRRLSGQVRHGPTAEHVQNVAALYRADSASGAQSRLIDDLEKIAANVGQIPGTAMGALAVAPSHSESATMTVVSTGPLNEAQERVIAAAMSSRLTVAQGPPGTGKSQLVGALVTTATAAGETVLVASSNNQPVDSVIDKVNEVHAGLIVRTGKKMYVQAEPDLLTDLLTEYSTGRAADEMTPAAELRVVQKNVSQFRTALDERRVLERDLADLAVERGEADATTALQLPDQDQALRTLVDRCERASRRRFFGWWDRYLLRRQYGPMTSAELEELACRSALELQWRERLHQLGQLPDEDSSWKGLKALVGGQRSRSSRALVLAQLDLRIRKGRRQIERRCDNLRGARPNTWQGFPDLLPILPAWAVTAYSARTFKDQPALFDLVIIDEAAQCHIPAILPLLFRAKRALIIGDPRQLEPVITLPPAEEDVQRAAAGVSEEWLTARQLSFGKHSIYDATATAAGATHLLDEHYRCHPDIIDAPNRRVYQGQLTVLTEPSNLAIVDGPAVRWVDVRGGIDQPEGGGAGYNEVEAREVAAEVARLVKEYPAASIGVTTPLRAQERRITANLRALGLADAVKCGTIHRFQGSERDIIVLSPVGADRLPDGTRRWLLSKINLWNVAITRAKSKLVVVGDSAWWSTQDSMLNDLRAAGDTGHPAGRATNQGADDLHAAIQSETSFRVRRDVHVGGQHFDLLVEGAKGHLAVMVDDPVGVADGRRLRQLLAGVDAAEVEARRLNGTDSETYRFVVMPVLRVPVWRCHSDMEGVLREVVDRCG